MANIKYTTKHSPVGITNFGGGLNSTSSALNLKENEASDLQNVDFDVFGSIKKRNGYATLNGSAFNSGATCTGLHWSEFASGTSFLLGTFGNEIAKMDDLDGTWDDITGGLTITAGDNNLFHFTTYNDTVLATNNVDPPIKWTGAGNAAAADVPTGLTDAQFVSNWNNYAFYANVQVSGTRYKSRLYWSNLKDITTWTATDFNDVSLDDGQEITGIAPLGDRFVIFKTRSIHIMLFTGDSDIPFVFFPSASDVGAISGYSIQKVANGLVFLAESGLYYFDGQSSTKISDRINTTLNSYAKGRFQYAVSLYQQFKNRYWLAFTPSGGSEHTKIITWDASNNAFSLYTGMSVNALATVVTSGEERPYFGDYSGYAYRADTGANDNPAGTETAITMFYKTRWISFGDIIDTKGVPHITLYHQIASSTLDFAYSYDLETADQYSQRFVLGTSGDTYNSAIWDSSVYAESGGKVIRRDLDGRGRVIRFNMSNNTLGETVQIDAMGFLPYLETVG